MIPTKIQVNWPFGREDEAKNRFSIWRPQRPSWISDRNDFSFCFLIYKSPLCFLPRFKSTSLSVKEMKLKIDFKDGDHGGHLGFPIRTILAILDLLVTPMLPTKFQVNWHFGSGEKVKN